ncbi:Aluminum-activated malate transporter 12 [Acorus calamus]|uniref:Aluminum-activated malate transporter 12 n=1 Tax=Acorus calamus TaxID=4465 RepID=A0AAV9CAF8_ACOCL|nr:Aluminum-activated malate transporter 12 [Acorus calamus]
MAKVRSFPVKIWEMVSKAGREDPRRVIHSLKVGVALTLVSFLYVLEPLFKDVGQNAMWASSLSSSCLNSPLVSIEDSGRFVLARWRSSSSSSRNDPGGCCGNICEVLPQNKKNYDYGVVIFLLTFNLITVSSYRVENVLHIARERLYTIAIGCGVCLLMSLLVCPNWSGEDLHNSMVYKLESLAKSIEECVKEYFIDMETKADEDEPDKDDPIYKGYRAVLDSKSTDEALAMFASWEPRHSRHCYKYPWEQYVKLGTVLRRFGYTAVALHGCLESEIQTPKSVRALFKDPCIRAVQEVSKVLTELASSMKQRRRCSPDVLSDHLHESLQDLNAAIKSQPRLFLSPNRPTNTVLSSMKTDTSALLEWRTKRDHPNHPKGDATDRKAMLRPTLSKIAITSLEFSEALPFAAFASLLVETAARLELVIEEVEELGRVAGFREYSEDGGVDVVVDKGIAPPLAPNHIVSQAVE